MPIDHEKLATTLNDLRSELADVDRLDPQDRELIRATLAEIQTKLATKQAPAAPSGSGGAIDRLRDAAMRLEESHPDLSSAIGNLAGILGQMGF
jgi:ABC-type transporter Mla subunit MlaD